MYYWKTIGSSEYVSVGTNHRRLIYDLCNFITPPYHASLLSAPDQHLKQ